MVDTQSAGPLPPDRRMPKSYDDPSTPNDGDTLGEYVQMGTDEIFVEDADDGGVFITIGQPYENPQTTHNDFYSNLAEVVSSSMCDSLATAILRLVDEDKQAREPRDKQYEEGIRRTGLGNDAPGGAQFEGASRVVHPMITKATIDYEARVMKELWPPSGPVKQKILGEVTRTKTERAKRKVEHMNWQLTTQIKEAFPVMEQSLVQAPLGGGAYIKMIWDHRLKRPRWFFIPVDKVWVPFNAASFYSASRRTVSETLSKVEFQQRVEQGLYTDLGLEPPALQPESTKSEDAARKVEGSADPGMNLDADREVYEVFSWLEVTPELKEYLEFDEEEGKLYPFLMHVDLSSKKCIGLYRDWEEGDETLDPIDHLFEIPFIPWRGAYSIGLTQIIGGLSGAATGALRAMLDSAFVRNTPGGLISKGSGTGGQTRRPQPGEFVELEGNNLESQDIKSRVLPFTFGPPDPTLFELLGFVVNEAAATIRTSLEQSAIDTNANTPVGTQLSRVEEGLVVFSQIHGRNHQALNRILRGLHRLNALYLPETLRVDADGKEIFVRRRDYEGPIDIIPVSDPTIFSDQQRFAQDTAIQMRSTQVPGLYKVRNVERRWLRRMKVGEQEIDELLQDAPTPHELNAVNENLAMALGQPVVVFPEQDHLSHIQAIVIFMQSPFLGANPVIAQKYLQAAVQHASQHMVYFYVRCVHDIVTTAAGTEASLLFSTDDKVKRRMDQLMAMASYHAVEKITQALGPMAQYFQVALQKIQQMTPPPPMDPATAAVQAATAETQRKAAADQAGHQLSAAELQQKGQQSAQENAVDWAKVNAMTGDAQLQSQTKIQTTQMDNDTAEQISEDRLSVGKQAGFSTGASLQGE